MVFSEKKNLLFLYSILVSFLMVRAYRYHYEDYDIMMSTCRENEACNIVHHRYWMPSAVEKICRCPLNTPSCPVTYSHHGHIMNINTRTQMKFCSSTKHLERCQSNQIALQKKTLYQKYGIKNVSIVARCQCDNTQQHWVYVNQTGEDINDERHQVTVVDNYRCVALDRCKPHDFCGYARPDYGFIFHRCTCPMGHQCKFDLDDYEPSEISELFYRGPAYRARCVPIYDYDWW
uniref:Putative conserved secreted protein n=1 Tax=Aedes albopictus TaxID=7160 RepID=A0A1W7R775_AEDAL|nr:U-scoloptoxin(11)-Sm6a-like [Aedes albopictus]XP_029721957.1 U-scoloptoxin(11)-Sm6a-like [Aedes albopictus]